MQHKLHFHKQGILICILLVILSLHGGSPKKVVTHNFTLETKNTKPSFVLHYTEHDPLLIDGNDELRDIIVEERWPGNGTAENPYEFNGYAISRRGERELEGDGLIDIRNTDIPFRIINCFIANSTNHGIFFHNVSNGHISNNNVSNNSAYGMWAAIFRNSSISNNTFDSNNEGEGIILWDSDYIAISGNVISNNAYDGIDLLNSENIIISNNSVINNLICGIRLQNSLNNIISNNSIESNKNGPGIVLWESSDNTFSDNIILNSYESGISLSGSGNNRIVNNTIDQGLDLFGWQIEHYFQSEVINNTVNGQLILYWKNLNGGTIPTGMGQIILVNARESTVVNQNLSNVSVGLLAVYSPDLLIFNNTICNNSKTGIHLEVSWGSTISANTVLYNRLGGIEIQQSGPGWIESTILTDNIVAYNGEHGMFIEQSYNIKIVHNTVSYNDGNGIEVWDCDLSNISDNNVANNRGAGIACGDSRSSVVNNNDIAGNNGHGIELWDFDDSSFSENNITNSGHMGVNLGYSTNTTISNNVISRNDQVGIYLWESSDSTLTENIVSSNDRYGISLHSSTENIEITRNDFIGNNAGEDSQAYDGGLNNSFSHNHWDDWIIDRNTDGIVDQPYYIDGEANNRDPFPQTWSTSDTTVRTSTNIIIGVILLILTLAVLFLLIRKQKRT